MYEPNIRGNAAGQAFKPGTYTARHQPRALDEINDGWIGVIDRAGSGIHPIYPPKANRALIYPACHPRKSIDPPKTLDPRVPRRTSRSLGCFPLAAACLKVKNLTKLAQFRPA